MKEFKNLRLRMRNLVNRFNLKPYAQPLAQRIKIRTRLGFGLEQPGRGGKRRKLKKLTDRYKKRRRRSRLHSETQPGKSNLTFTGQLLNAIFGKASGDTITIGINPKRRDGISNADLVKWQEEQGRPFFDLTDKEIKGLRTEIKKDLIKAMRKKF